MATQRYVSTELHHFVGRALPDDAARYEALLAILRSGRLRPGRLDGAQHADPDAPGIAIAIDPDTEEIVKAEVVCFCDIPADDLGLHMSKYGPFGISFPKHSCVSTERTRCSTSPATRGPSLRARVRAPRSGECFPSR